MPGDLVRKGAERHAFELSVREPGARALAEATDTSLTEAVTSALRTQLEAATQPTATELVLAEVVEIQRFVADLPDRDPRPADELLGYDPDTGLNR